MITKCAQCGKRTVVLYPDLWAYKRGNAVARKYLCSWSCLREYDKEKGVEDMSLTQVKKDGTPAKKPGRKPAKKQIETPEGEFVTVATKVPPTVINGVEYERLEQEKPEKPETPVNQLEFKIVGIEGQYGRFVYDKARNEIIWSTEDGEAAAMSPTSWRIFAKQMPRVVELLLTGVEL